MRGRRKIIWNGRKEYAGKEGFGRKVWKEMEEEFAMEGKVE